jgi:WS/DGAT C-terminal domain
MYFLTKLILQFPYPLASLIIDFLGDKPTMYFTNVFAASAPLKIAGYASQKISTLTPFMKDVTGGMAVVSHQDKLWVSFSADIGRCKDTAQIIQIYEKTMEEVLRS